MANEIINGAGIHHIALKAKDFDKSVAFYTGMGFKITAAWGEGDKRICMLDIGDGCLIEMFAGGTDVSEGPIIHLAFHVKCADQAYEAGIKAGGVSSKPPYDFTIPSKPAPMDVRLAFIIGPDGETIEFFQKR